MKNKRKGNNIIYTNISDMSSNTSTPDTIDKSITISKPELVETYSCPVEITSYTNTTKDTCINLAHISRPVLRRSNENTHVRGNHTGITKSKDSAIDILEEYFLREHK